MALNEYEIKKQICDIGKRIYDRNMVVTKCGSSAGWRRMTEIFP